MTRKMRKDVSELVRYAERRGFALVGQTGSGHWRLRHPRCGLLIVGQTPSGRRWSQNTKSLIERKLKSQNPKDER